MNTSFRNVFTVEEDFTEPDLERPQGGLQEVRVRKQEIKRLLENLDVRKAI